MYEKVVDKKVLSVVEMFADFCSDLEYIISNWGIMFHELPRSSHVLMLRICQKRKTSEELKTIPRTAPELLHASRRRPKSVPTGTKRVSLRSKKRQGSESHCS